MAKTSRTVTPGPFPTTPDQISPAQAKKREDEEETLVNEFAEGGLWRDLYHSLWRSMDGFLELRVYHSCHWCFEGVVCPGNFNWRLDGYGYLANIHDPWARLSISKRSISHLMKIRKINEICEEDLLKRIQTTVRCFNLKLCFSSRIYSMLSACVFLNKVTWSH